MMILCAICLPVHLAMGQEKKPEMSPEVKQCIQLLQADHPWPEESEKVIPLMDEILKGPHAVEDMRILLKWPRYGRMDVYLMLLGCDRKLVEPAMISLLKDYRFRNDVGGTQAAWVLVMMTNHCEDESFLAYLENQDDEGAWSFLAARAFLVSRPARVQALAIRWQDQRGEGDYKELVQLLSLLGTQECDLTILRALDRTLKIRDKKWGASDTMLAQIESLGNSKWKVGTDRLWSIAKDPDQSEEMVVASLKALVQQGQITEQSQVDPVLQRLIDRRDQKVYLYIYTLEMQELLESIKSHSARR